MSVKWLLSKIGNASYDTEDIGRIQQELERQGIEHAVTSYKDVLCGYPMPYDSSDDVFVFGSISVVAELVKRFGWLSWMPLNKLKCSSYYNAFGASLTQQNYVMMPAGEVLRKWYDLTAQLHHTSPLADYVGWSGELFIRPDGNNKRFTGGVFTRDEYESLLRGIEPNLILVVAEPIKIETEWRVLMVDGKVITGSIYAPKEDRQVQVPVSEQLEFWWQQAVESNPYDTVLPGMVCFDVAFHDGRHSLLELSSVNACGIYEMNVELFVKAVTERAEYEYATARLGEESWK